MQCLNCKNNYGKLTNSLCKACLEYLVWRGIIGPGKDLKNLIKKINKENVHDLLPIGR